MRRAARPATARICETKRDEVGGTILLPMRQAKTVLRDVSMPVEKLRRFHGEATLLSPVWSENQSGDKSIASPWEPKALLRPEEHKGFHFSLFIADP